MKFLCQYAILLLSNVGFAANLIDGEILYKESCIRCHGSDIHKEIALEDIVQLKVGIQLCVNALYLPWNQTDINDTAGYLDSQYFHFDKTLKANGKN